MHRTAYLIITDLLTAAIIALVGFMFAAGTIGIVGAMFCIVALVATCVMRRWID